MDTPSHQIVFAFVTAAVLSGVAQAFTDANAELKEAAARNKLGRVVVVGKAVPPPQAAWVPPSAKRLDGFKPVLPSQRAPVPSRSQAEAVAQADARR